MLNFNNSDAVCAEAAQISLKSRFAYVIRAGNGRLIATDTNPRMNGAQIYKTYVDGEEEPDARNYTDTRHAETRHNVRLARVHDAGNPR